MILKANGKLKTFMSPEWQMHCILQNQKNKKAQQKK